ncbi:acyl-CoA carboxylase epsilon subunit [Nocardiopsis sp. NPDC049922]|uniref:acyl-CoA carboxylase epsilon subunit n=1 Tax=Nocardiopsis sp. NPDC049922 TaxID=3155157 RepID=UPI0033C7DDEE
MNEPTTPPHVVVVRGAPSDEELAALAAVLSARAARRATDAAEATEPVSGWRDRARNLRAQVPPRPGPGAWRLSMR